MCILKKLPPKISANLSKITILHSKKVFVLKIICYMEKHIVMQFQFQLIFLIFLHSLIYFWSYFNFNVKRDILIWHLSTGISCTKLSYRSYIESNLGRNITTFATHQNPQYLKIPILNCSVFLCKLIFKLRLLKSSHVHHIPSKTNRSLLKNNCRSWWCNLHFNRILLQNACFLLQKALLQIFINICI